MPLTGFYLIGAGLLIALLAGIFLLINMGLGVRDMLQDDMSESIFARVFGGHVAAMGAMCLGGGITFLGILVAVVQAIQTYG